VVRFAAGLGWTQVGTRSHARRLVSACACSVLFCSSAMKRGSLLRSVLDGWGASAGWAGPGVGLEGEGGGKAGAE